MIGQKQHREWSLKVIIMIDGRTTFRRVVSRSSRDLYTGDMSMMIGGVERVMPIGHHHLATCVAPTLLAFRCQGSAKHGSKRNVSTRSSVYQQKRPLTSTVRDSDVYVKT